MYIIGSMRRRIPRDELQFVLGPVHLLGHVETNLVTFALHSTAGYFKRPGNRGVRGHDPVVSHKAKGENRIWRNLLITSPRYGEDRGVMLPRPCFH